MRIALVSPYDLSVHGGVQSHVLQLARTLRAGGDQVVVLAPGVAAAHLSVGRGVGVRFNGSVAPIAVTPSAARRTSLLLRRLRPDVVHVHEPMVPVVGLAAASTSVAPVVATFHAWSDRVGLYRAVRPLARRVLRDVAVALAVSPAAADHHARAIGVSPDTFEVVPNGVEVARFDGARPLEAFDGETGPVLLFVGRLERRKGLEPLLRAFLLLHATRPELRLVVVGDGPERARCERLLPSRAHGAVRFLGRVDQQALPRWYATADVYVSPALGGESFGIVLLEAMAAGRAVVASDIPGYRSVVADGAQGRLVPPGDPEALADAIACLLDDQTLRRSMAAEGRRTVAGYDWGVVTERVRGAYLAAIEGGA